MNKIKVFTTLLLSMLGVLGANEYYKPKNMGDLLKWRGVKLASDDRVWKSMFFEHKDELEKMNIKDEKSLWTLCSEKFKTTNLNDEQVFEETKKYCSDNPISIMARIIRDGEDNKLIKDNFGFSINYLLASNKEEILKLINFTETNPPQDLGKVSEKLSKWCEEQKREKIINSNDLAKFGEFKKRCYGIGVRNFSELLKKQGRRLISDPNEFKKRLIDDKLQYAPKLIEELKKILKDKVNLIRTKIMSSDIRHSIPEIPEDSKAEELLKNQVFLENFGGLIYKSYCDSKWSKSLIQETNDLKEFEEVSFRCTEKT